jgi:hypothetical protein
MFMNGVDCMDQYHSTLAMQQKELWLHMALYTYLLDLATCQAYALHQTVAAKEGKKGSQFSTLNITYVNYK